jgi:hypothetical protein
LITYFHRYAPPSTILALIGPNRPLDKAKEDLKNIAEAGTRKMPEERVQICKKEGKIDQVSYRIEAGKPVDEIITYVYPLLLYYNTP